MNAERAMQLFDSHVPQDVKLEIGRRAYELAALRAVHYGNRALESRNEVGPGATQESANALGHAEAHLWSLVRSTMEDADRRSTPSNASAQAPAGLAQSVTGASGQSGNTGEGAGQAAEPKAETVPV